MREFNLFLFFTGFFVVTACAAFFEYFPCAFRAGFESADQGTAFGVFETFYIAVDTFAAERVEFARFKRARELRFRGFYGIIGAGKGNGDAVLAVSAGAEAVGIIFAGGRREVIALPAAIIVTRIVIGTGFWRGEFSFGADDGGASQGVGVICTGDGAVGAFPALGGRLARGVVAAGFCFCIEAFGVTGSGVPDAVFVIFAFYGSRHAGWGAFQAIFGASGGAFIFFDPLVEFGGFIFRAVVEGILFAFCVIQGADFAAFGTFGVADAGFAWRGGEELVTFTFLEHAIGADAFIDAVSATGGVSAEVFFAGDAFGVGAIGLACERFAVRAHRGACDAGIRNVHRAGGIFNIFEAADDAGIADCLTALTTVVAVQSDVFALSGFASDLEVIHVGFSSDFVGFGFARRETECRHTRQDET